MKWDGLTFQIKPTGFGHMGSSPNTLCHWPWIQATDSSRRPGSIAAFFICSPYTGAMTLLAARSGAEVCHVDAVPDVNDWARQNAERPAGSGMRPSVGSPKTPSGSWAREIRRPAAVWTPSFSIRHSYGRGPKGEKWILEEHLLETL